MQNKCGKNQYYCGNFFICVVKIHMYMKNTIHMEDNFILLIFFIYVYVFYKGSFIFIHILRYMKLLVVNHFNNKIGTFIRNIFSISIFLFTVFHIFNFFCCCCILYCWTTTKPWTKNGKLTEHNNNFSFNCFSPSFSFSLLLVIFWNITNLIFSNVWAILLWMCVAGSLSVCVGLFLYSQMSGLYSIPKPEKKGEKEILKVIIFYLRQFSIY